MRKLPQMVFKILKPALSVAVVAAIFFAACIYCGNKDLPGTLNGKLGGRLTETSETDISDTETCISETVTEVETEITEAPTTAYQTTTAVIKTSLKTTTSSTHTTRFTQTSQFSKSDYISSVIRISNDYRSDAGVGMLSRDTTLMNAAQTRAEECAAIDNIRVNGKPHTRPDGSAWYTVFGITENYNYGENTGQGCDTPDYMMELWMSSEGHKTNILNSDYTAIGVGCAVSSDGTVYCVQLFYRP